MPALLPDGTQSRLSVSGVLAAQAAEGRVEVQSGRDLDSANPGPAPADEQEDEQ